MSERDETIEALKGRIAALEGRLSAAQGAERQLLSSRRMLKLVLDTIPVRVFWKDRQGRYLGCNGPFARDAGLGSSEEIVGRTDHDLGWRQQADLYRADDRAVIESGVARIAYEEPQTAPDGSRMWLRTSKIPLVGDDGAIVGVLGVYEDITAQKRAEEERLSLELQMQHAQKLESLGVLAGGIAHDFKNLLMVILGNLELARACAPADAPIVEPLLASELGARRAAELCRQLLAYSGRGRFEVQPLDLNTLVREMVELLGVSLSKKARFLLELEEALPAIDADPAQLRQVVMNLVTNASEALADGVGTIRLATGNRVATPDELRDIYTGAQLSAGRYVCLEIEDSGLGIAEENLARVFEPFFTTKFTGRGLGLAAVSGIVRGHAGAMDVESTPGLGTRFRVFLPVSARRAVSPPAGGICEALPPKPARVLVVDDEAMVRRVAEQMVRALGFEAVTAADGNEALALYRPGEFACVILDVTMPGCDGPEAMLALRRRDPEVRVILATGYDADDIQERLGAVRPDGFLEKPFSLSSLERALARVLA